MFAKSKRFEDKPVGCGADAAYDPKDITKPIGGVIPTVDRFIELKSPSSVKSDSESVHSEKSSQIFRTPKAIRRFPITASLKADSVNKPGLRNRSQSSDSFMKELLEAKCVELRHKDATIAEYETQIKQMKKQLNILEDDVVHFRQLTFIQETNQITDAANAYEQANRSATEEINKLNENIHFMKSENESLLKQIDSLKNNDDTDKLQKQLFDLKHERDVVKSMLSEFNSEINKENCDEEITDGNLPDTLLAFIDAYHFEINAIAALQSALSTSEKEIANLKQANVEQHEKILGEKELIAKLEQRVSELNDYDEKRSMDTLGMSEIINTKDALCNDLLEQLSDGSRQIDELKENIALLKGHHSLALEANESNRHEYKMEIDAMKCKHEDELRTLSAHCSDRIEEERGKFLTEIVNLKDEIERISIGKNKFMVTLETTRQTVEVLGSRLRNSDEDVEKMKLLLEESTQAKLTAENRLEKAEDNIKKLQGEYNQVLIQIIESKAALDQSHDDILGKNAQLLNSVTEMETEFASKIRSLNTTLLEDIDIFKQQCAQHIADLVSKLSYEHKLCKEMKSQCDDAYRMIHDCQNTLFQAECQLETKDQEMNELATENDKLAGTLAAVEQEKNELQLLLNEFRNMACDKDRRLHTLARQLDDKDREVFEVENRIKKMSEFLEATEFIIKEKDTEIIKLKDTVNELNSNECDVSLLHEEINKYIEQNHLLEFQKNQVLEDFNELQLEFEKVSQDEKQSKIIIKTKEQNIREYVEKNSILEKDVFEAEWHMKSCQQDQLKLQFTNLEKDLEEMTNKYTNLLSHQNNKQKIKHVIDLKALNNNLKEDNEKLTHTIHKQTATIEKMRREFAEINKMKSPLPTRKPMFCLSTPAGKENITSPLGKSPKTVTGSPKLNERPLTPLRESNR